MDGTTEPIEAARQHRTRLGERLAARLLMQFGGVSVLIVEGRRTGRPQQVFLAPIKLESGRYLLANRGFSQWARNLQAAGRGSLRGRRGAEDVRATRVEGEEYDRVIARFRATAPGPIRKLFERNPDPAVHPAFRIEPVGLAG